MKIYLAMVNGYEKPALRANVPNVLLSYFAFRDGPGEFARPAGLFIDSGAYSSWSLGKPLRVQDYAEYLLRWGGSSDVYANLDVVQSATETEANQRYLERRGLRPAPVFHWGEPYELLARMCEEYPRVLCSGTATNFGEGRRTHGHFLERRTAHFARVFEVAAKRNTRVHGFGVTDPVIVKAFPWDSVDSSSWSRAVQYGVCPLFDPSTGNMTNVPTSRRPAVEKVRALLRDVYDAGVSDLFNPASSRLKIVAISLKSWVLFEAWLNRRRPPVESKDGAGQDDRATPTTGRGARAARGPAPGGLQPAKDHR